MRSIRVVDEIKPRHGWDLAKYGWDLNEWLERLTANAEVETVLGWIPASSDTVEYEGRQMKQCWMQYIQKKSNKSPCWFVVQTIVAVYCGELHFWNRLLWMVQNVAIDGAKLFQSCCNMLRLLVQCVALTDIRRLRERKGGWREGPPWGKDSRDMISIEEPNPALLSLPPSALPTSRPPAPSRAGMINICLEHNSSILGRSNTLESSGLIL